MRIHSVVCLLAFALVVLPAPSLQAAEPGVRAIVIPANTPVEFKLLDTVSSRTGKPGDAFRLQVFKPLIIDGVVAIAAGTPASGEVVHAEKSRFGGKAGELIVAPRFVELPGQRIPLRSTFSAAGTDATNAALAVGMVTGGIGAVIKGKETELAAGLLLSARVAGETAVSVTTGSSAVPGENPSMSAGDVP